MRRKLIDLMDQRTKLVENAETALQAGNQEAYNDAMTKVRNANTEIDRIQALVAEQDRYAAKKTPTAAEYKDMAEERANTLMKGGAVTFSAQEVHRAIVDSTTLATGNLVEPTGDDSNIRDLIGNTVSSIVDQVNVQNLAGMGSYLVPYVISELEAGGGKVKTLAGTARAASVDPTFGVAEIKPYEMNITTYVDRNISRLTHADYYAKIYGMAMRAMRRKLANLILNGDGQASPDMFGLKNAKNKAGNPIYTTHNVTGIDVDLLDDLYFAYGSDDMVGPNARVFLTKQDLKAFGKLRGANEKRRLFDITHDASNPNVGVIQDGGVAAPYTICSDLTPLAGTAAGAADIQTMLYGDPKNYTLGLFGDFTIRVDESVKAVERMLTILGDAFVGGNLTVHQGAVIATLAKAGG